MIPPRLRNVVGPRRSLASVAAAVLLALGGCVASPPPTAIPSFRQGVLTAEQQTTLAFAEINLMLRRQQLDRIERMPSIGEEAFIDGVPVAARLVWSRAFASIDAYAAELEVLLSPDRRQRAEADLRTLGQALQVQYGVAVDEVPPGIAAGFVRLGGLLREVRSREQALAAAQSADPAIQEILGAMAAAIGEDAFDGLRGTVWTAWTQQLGGVQLAYLEAAETRRRAVAMEFLDMLDERATHDRALASLRRSLLTLAAAHRRIAFGAPASAEALLSMVDREFIALRTEIQRIRTGRGGGSRGGGGDFDKSGGGEGTGAGTEKDAGVGTDVDRGGTR